MNAIESHEIVSDDTEQLSDSLKVVPVAESIRYRKRAQGAEKKVEDLAEQLAEAKSQSAKLSEQLNDIQLEHQLMRKLAAAGTVDLETATLIVKARTGSDKDTDLNSVIEQLKKEKQYLFAGTSGVATAKKTAVAKDRMQNSQTIIERAAKKAATTGNRTDLQEYLKLRRKFM